MKVDILKESKNILLGREDILLRIESDGPTPSESAILKEIAKMFKTNEDFILISKIDQKYGKMILEVKAEIHKQKVAKKKKAKAGEEGEKTEVMEEPKKDKKEVAENAKEESQ